MTDKTPSSLSKNFPAYGWLGVAIMVGAELMLLRGNALIATWLTPILWTGYILCIDALAYRIKGNSLLTRNKREIPFLVLISVGVWLLFEALNLHLKNWVYLGLPQDPAIRNLGYFWSFGTIMPGVFVTIELLAAIFPKLERPGAGPQFPSQLSNIDRISIVLGVVMVLFPLFLSSQIAAYLFGFIWLGFIFLLGPINKLIGAQTAIRLDNPRSILITLLAGLVCGFLWEAWNFQAFNANGAYWQYTLPAQLQFLGVKFGMMPILGLLGFPPFAVELVYFYAFSRKIIGGDRVFGVGQ